MMCLTISNVSILKHISCRRIMLFVVGIQRAGSSVKKKKKKAIKK